MFYKLNTFINMVEKEKRIVTNSEINMKDMECTKWRSLLTYSIQRNIAKKVKGQDHDQIVKKITEKLTAYLNMHGATLRIPVWKILYNQRKER